MPDGESCGIDTNSLQSECHVYKFLLIKKELVYHSLQYVLREITKIFKTVLQLYAEKDLPFF